MQHTVAEIFHYVFIGTLIKLLFTSSLAASLSEAQVNSAVANAILHAEVIGTSDTSFQIPAPKPYRMSDRLFRLPPNWDILPYVPGIHDRGSSPVYQNENV